MPATDMRFQSDDPDEPRGTLYVPVPQIRGTPKWDIEYVWVTPTIARQWLDTSEQDETFRNRKLSTAQVRHYAALMDTNGVNRFVNFLPNGVICFDEHGILLNGKTRLHAVMESGSRVGFVVFRGVPRWMWPFMDTHRVKTARDVFYGSYRVDKPTVIATMKLVLRYEEFLTGINPPTGWRAWAKARDQHSDLDRVYEQREELADYYGNAMVVRKGCNLLATSLMVFEFYQWHAWPEGRPALESFLTGLRDGSGMYSGSAALSLREFGTKDFCPTEGKPLIHLILLFRHFGAYSKKEKIPRATWGGYGQELLPPYHPDGPEAAKANLRKALPPLNEVKKR